MGGKPHKPKIQAYVEQRWFNEFEVYRSTHNLNQSRALEQILAEFFGGASASTLPLDGAIATSNLVYALRSELVDLKLEIDHRLRLVESRLAIESAIESATSTDATISTDESATESARTQNELALPLDESAVHLDGLATESATPQAESAIVEDESAIESAVDITESASESSVGQDESATAPDGLASESAIVEDARAVNPLEVEDTALGDIGEVENASVGNTLEDIAAPSQEQNLEPLTSKKLGKRLGKDNATISRHKSKGNEHFRVWSASLDPDGIAWEYRDGEYHGANFHPLV